MALVRTCFARAGLIGRIFFKPPTLKAGSSVALQPTETHSTSLEISKPPLLTQSLFKSLAALLIHFISIQSDLISIVLMYWCVISIALHCRMYLHSGYIPVITNTNDEFQKRFPKVDEMVLNLVL